MSLTKWKFCASELSMFYLLKMHTVLLITNLMTSAGSLCADAASLCLHGARVTGSGGVPVGSGGRSIAASRAALL